MISADHADGYRPFRRDKQGKRDGGVALYVRECLQFNVMSEKAVCLGVKIRGKAN